MFLSLFFSLLYCDIAFVLLSLYWYFFMICHVLPYGVIKNNNNMLLVIRSLISPRVQTHLLHSDHMMIVLFGNVAKATIACKIVTL